MATTTSATSESTPPGRPGAVASEAPAAAAQPTRQRLRLGFLTHLHVGADAPDSYRIALDLFEAEDK